MTPEIEAFLSGMITMAFAACALFFVRFHRATGDRLFSLFAFAFAMLSIERALLAVFDFDEGRPYVYVIRLIAFGFILVAVIDKNRAKSTP